MTPKPKRSTTLPTPAVALTPIALAAIKPQGDRFEIRDALVPGLRVRVRPSGRKIFILRYSFGGEYKVLTLGDFPAVTLKAARDAAQEAQEALAAGRDPGAARTEKRSLPAAAASLTGHPEAVDPDNTVTAAIEVYKRDHLPGLALGTQAYYRAECERLVTAFGPRTLTSITQPDLAGYLRQAKKRGPVAYANSHKGVCAIFNYLATDAGVPSPALGLKRHESPHKPDNERFLSDAEIPIVWAAATAAGGSVGVAVKLLLATGCRRNEIFYLHRTEVSATAITITAGRAKNRRTLQIPITPFLGRILAECPTGGAFVVTGADAGLGGHSKARKKIKDGLAEPFSFHDLRRTVMTGLATLGVDNGVAHRCLNQIVGGKQSALAKIYDRSDYQPKVDAAFALWHDHLAKLVEQPAVAVAA